MRYDPRTFRLSEHFVLSDFLGCHSVYSRGFPNPFDFDARDSSLKLDNVRCLCDEGLEPLMQEYGPLSISYGYISPALSRKLVTYQDPDKPSHHRFDLGAAADICVHGWVCDGPPTIDGLILPDSVIGSPIALAHAIEYLGIPYSRLITYSESPYLCLAISAREVVRDEPRKAFYENRYGGKAKAKPDYRQYSSYPAKVKAFEHLQAVGLTHGWEGAGYPTYHGGGHCQYHHRRVSRYTMVSDWLFDLKSISDGAKNIPALNLESVQDAFAAAGIVYDWMIDTWGVKRASIVEGYVCHLNPSHADYNDWREGTIRFAVNPPDKVGTDLQDYLQELGLMVPDGAQFTIEDDFIVAVVEVEEVLSQEDWGPR